MQSDYGAPIVNFRSAQSVPQMDRQPSADITLEWSSVFRATVHSSSCVLTYFVYPPMNTN